MVNWIEMQMVGILVLGPFHDSELIFDELSVEGMVALCSIVE